MILVLLDPRPMDGKISFFCLPPVRCHFRQQSKMKTNVVFDISPPIPVLAEFWFSIYGPKCCQPIKLQNYIKCNISKRKWMMKCIFYFFLNIKVFYKLILWFWVWVTSHAKNTKKMKFAYLCDISRKIWEMKLIFCLQIKMNVFFKLIVSPWVCVARHA